MVVAIVCLLIALLLGLFIFRPRGDAAGQATRSRRARASERSALPEEPGSESEMPFLDDEASDEVLGLKPSVRDDLAAVAEASLAAASAKPEQEAQPLEPESKIIALHVMAPSGYPYRGYELLQALLANGLRYGDMQIFHRHETKTGRGKVLFSLASVVQPGTFDLPKMGSFSSPGLSLFMVLKPAINNMLAFDTLLETAKQLADDLGGEVKDAARRSLNMHTVAELRRQVKHFDETRRVSDLFEETLEVR